MSKEFAGVNEDGSMKTIDKTMRMTDEGLEKLSAANIGGKFGAIVEAEKNKREENK